jgi:sugar O-acyltransferase (sialic acid O-acetyltransferase NeuD family)
MKKDILLIGGGGHCKSVIDVIEQENRFKIAGIIDKQESIGDEVLGYKIIGCDNDLDKLYNSYNYAFITIGHIKSNNLRVKLFNLIKSIGYIIPTIISPLAYVSKYSFIDKGSIIMHHSLINANVKIGKNCIINSKALIEHDSIIKDNCHISTGAILNGGVVVRENSFIGSNATIREYTKVEGFIKAGSLIK